MLVPEMNEKRQPFEEWDGSTVYFSDDGVATPSALDSELVSVYGEGSKYGVKLTLAQAMEVYWRWKEYKIGYAPLNITGVGSFSAQAGVASISSVTFDRSEIVAQDMFGTTHMGRGKYPDYNQPPQWSDVRETSLLCGSPSRWFIDSSIDPDAYILQQPSAFSTGISGGASNVSYASPGAGAYAAFSCSLTLSDNLFGNYYPFIKTGTDEYWVSCPLDFSAYLYQNAYSYLIPMSPNSSSDRAGESVTTQIAEIFTNYHRVNPYFERIGGNQGGLGQGWIDLESVSSISIPVKFSFSSSEDAEGSFWAMQYMWPPSVSTIGSGATSSVSLYPSAIIPTFEYSPVKFFTYGGVYDEDSGMNV